MEWEVLTDILVKAREGVSICSPSRAPAPLCPPIQGMAISRHMASHGLQLTGPIKDLSSLPAMSQLAFFTSNIHELGGGGHHTNTTTLEFASHLLGDMQVFLEGVELGGGSRSPRLISFCHFVDV